MAYSDFMDNLHPLRVFLTVAGHMSFSRAGEALHISQSAVSMQVKTLENMVGLPLFNRDGRRMVLTAAGATLLDYGHRVFALLDETRQVMEAEKGGRRGTLTVSADTTAGVYVVPQYLAHFHREYPDVKIALNVVNRTQVMEHLQHREADLGIMGYIPQTSDEWAVAPFLENELVVIGPADHPWRDRSRLSWREVQEASWLVREAGSGTRQALDRVLGSRGLTLRPAMELGSNSAIKQAVMHGLGISVLSRRVIEFEIATGRLIVLDVEDFPIRRAWYVVHPKNAYLAPPAVAMKELFLR